MLIKMIVKDSSLKQKENAQIFVNFKKGKTEIFELWQLLPKSQDV